MLKPRIIVSSLFIAASLYFAAPSLAHGDGSAGDDQFDGRPLESYDPPRTEEPDLDDYPMRQDPEDEVADEPYFDRRCPHDFDRREPRGI